jgi:hypothetical protein
MGEITALEVRCKNCPGLVSFPLGYKIPEFLNCPGCGQNLFDSGPTSATISKIYAALGQWNRIGDASLNLTFTVEMDEEKEEERKAKSQARTKS